MTNELEYYARPGLMTDTRDQVHLFDVLPDGLPHLASLLQNLMLYIYWTDRYGLSPSEERKHEVQLRTVSAKLERVRKLDPRPLDRPRPLEKRLLANSRDFALMLCAMLRYQGRPARVRCGFCTYLTPGKFEEHWVCEAWDSRGHCWIQIDSQLDAFQCRVLNIDFDTLDLPPGVFTTAGEAWLMCREGIGKPERFGLFDQRGMSFIRGNVIRDILCLNKVEVLPWDSWGLMGKAEEELSGRDLDFVDGLARLCVTSNRSFHEIRHLYQNDDRLYVPMDLEI
jgi:hypothetical protein